MITPKTPIDRPKNHDQFKPGHDPRLHRFTRDECVKGFWAALESIITRYPKAEKISIDNAKIAAAAERIAQEGCVAKID